MAIGRAFTLALDPVLEAGRVGDVYAIEEGATVEREHAVVLAGACRLLELQHVDRERKPRRQRSIGRIGRQRIASERGSQVRERLGERRASAHLVAITPEQLDQLCPRHGAPCEREVGEERELARSAAQVVDLDAARIHQFETAQGPERPGARRGRKLGQDGGHVQGTRAAHGDGALAPARRAHERHPASTMIRRSESGLNRLPDNAFRFAGRIRPPHNIAPRQRAGPRPRPRRVSGVNRTLDNDAEDARSTAQTTPLPVAPGDRGFGARARSSSRVVHASRDGSKPYRAHPLSSRIRRRRTYGAHVQTSP